MTDSRDFKKEYPASSYFSKCRQFFSEAIMLRHIWFAEVITRTLCVPASAFNLP